MGGGGLKMTPNRIPTGRYIKIKLNGWGGTLNGQQILIFLSKMNDFQ